MPRDAVATAVVFLLGLLVVVPVMWAPGWTPRYEAAPHEYVAAATGFALLRFWAHAWDRRHGAPRHPLRQYLAAMFFFPTFLNGPIESTEDFVARRTAGGVAPDTPADLLRHLRATAVGLARVAAGVLLAAVAMILLNQQTADVFASGGEAVTHPRLWLWALELGVAFFLGLGGLTEVAIGLGAMTGSAVGRNFDAPWAARGPREFWSRWYVSLGRWLRRYVYRPLGGGRRHATLNVCVVFLASAAWFAWTAVSSSAPPCIRRGPGRGSSRGRSRTPRSWRRRAAGGRASRLRRSSVRRSRSGSSRWRASRSSSRRGARSPTAAAFSFASPGCADLA
jgi:D-alanyl-lipoteichoic acid acyltransferase DltB (MBOAT superfamily)